MTSSPRTSPHRPNVFLFLFVVALSAVFPSVAGAQGRCSCNNGCHAYPGQCVQRGSSGCDPGFAPFCGTRATSCPNAGWVSCAGDCTCVRVGPSDGGTASDGGINGDASTPTDASPLIDRPAASDATPASDATATTDARSPMDAPSPADAPASASDATAAASDSPTGSDALVSLPDQVAVPSDSATPDRDANTTDPDGGCICAGGACVGGSCYRERCTFHPELGFTCATPGKTCRLIGADPICVPVCAGVTCAAGEFCDERSNGACVVDRCASLACPAGTTCVRNQCGRWGGPDGGVFIADEGDASADGGAAPPPTTNEGCGCRVGTPAGRDARWWWMPVVLLALLGRSVRRRSGSQNGLRCPRRSPGHAPQH